ncbi:MAG: NAD-dependent epimerase/dehydratase family protein [Steroidobacteraceae bacterium]
MSDGRVIAVTGATGFLGRHLVEALAREGRPVRVLARRDGAPESWRALPLEVVRGSLEEARSLERLTRGAEAVVHVAGLTKARDPADFLRVNRDGVRAVAEAAREYAPTARIVAISSLAAREPQLSYYAASKRAGEEAARGVYRAQPDRLVIVRPPVIYGPWDTATLAIFEAASHALVPIFGSGRVAIVHVSDAAAAIARLATGAGEAGLYALADDNPAGYSVRDLLGEAARAVGCSPRYVRIPAGAVLVAGRASGWWGRLRGRAPHFSAGKAREMLHPDWSVSASELLPFAIYRSRIGISEGFRTTAAWYKEAQWLH